MELPIRYAARVLSLIELLSAGVIPKRFMTESIWTRCIVSPQKHNQKKWSNSRTIASEKKLISHIERPSHKAAYRKSKTFFPWQPDTEWVVTINYLCHSLRPPVASCLSIRGFRAYFSFRLSKHWGPSPSKVSGLQKSLCFLEADSAFIKFYIEVVPGPMSFKTHNLVSLGKLRKSKFLVSRKILHPGLPFACLNKMKYALQSWHTILFLL
jgi:hypothetical protein